MKKLTRRRLNHTAKDINDFMNDPIIKAELHTTFMKGWSRRSITIRQGNFSINNPENPMKENTIDLTSKVELELTSIPNTFSEFFTVGDEFTYMRKSYYDDSDVYTWYRLERGFGDKCNFIVVNDEHLSFLLEKAYWEIVRLNTQKKGSK